MLPRRPDGTVGAQPTPPELDNRRFPTIDVLKPGLASSVSPVPDDVIARSTWTPQCPVTRDDLRYVIVPFWGFDNRAHTGELLVHRTAADKLVKVFRVLFDARFPIEEMHISPASALEAPPTGDGNDTEAFACRPTRGAKVWSQHAYGLAIDVNPFQNPYQKGDVILPELATSYTDRTHVRAGMILPGGAAMKAFASIGWTWGGTYTSLKDRMHFSANGR